MITCSTGIYFQELQNYALGIQTLGRNHSRKKSRNTQIFPPIFNNYLVSLIFTTVPPMELSLEFLPLKKHFISNEALSQTFTKESNFTQMKLLLKVSLELSKSFNTTFEHKLETSATEPVRFIYASNNSGHIYLESCVLKLRTFSKK